MITTVAAATTPRKKRSSSLFSASFKRRWSTRKYTLKLTENSRANTAMIISITGLPYAPHTGVPVGEAAGPRGGKGVDEGVIQGHPRQLEEDHLQGGHGEVDGIQDLGGLRLLGDQLEKTGPGLSAWVR